MKNLYTNLPAAILSLGLVCSSISASAQHNALMATGGADNGTPTKSTSNTKHADSKDERHNFSTDIHGGILTVDGMVGKAQLSYTVHQEYLYFTIPGVGTAIVSQGKFLNALPQKDAFHGNSLTIQASGHTVELTNDGPLVGSKVAEAWVAIDPLYGATRRFPEMGFGDTIQRPYVWPGAKAEKPSASNAGVVAPLLPPGIRPKPEVSSSYSVTVPASAPSVKQGK